MIAEQRVGKISDATAPAGPLEALSANLDDAVAVLTGRGFNDVGGVVSRLEPFIAQLQDLKHAAVPAADSKSVEGVRKNLHRLNEVTQHLHLVHRGLLDIGRVADGSYGPDGLMKTAPPASLRGEG